MCFNVYWSLPPQLSQNRASELTGLPQLGQNLLAEDCIGRRTWPIDGPGGVDTGWLVARAIDIFFGG